MSEISSIARAKAGKECHYIVVKSEHRHLKELVASAVSARQARFLGRDSVRDRRRRELPCINQIEKTEHRMEGDSDEESLDNFYEDDPIDFPPPDRPQIRVSFSKFLRTGQLGPIKIGISREEVLTLLGRPTWSINIDKRPYPERLYEPEKLREPDSWKRDEFWNYGDLSLSFADDILNLIHFPLHGRGITPILVFEDFVPRSGLTPEMMKIFLEQNTIEYLENLAAKEMVTSGDCQLSFWRGTIDSIFTPSDTK